MGIRFLKIAVIYFLVAVFMGMFMSISHQFQYAPSHAHMNLLGWVSLALAGIIYHLFPNIAENKLAKTHFWLHNIGLPVMMIGLIILESGNTAIEPVIAIGATVTTIGIIAFVYNVVANLKATVSRGPSSKRNIQG
ncbi:cbb3-type cytochrome c oxidase subunit I [Ammoniphilus resinae]|uniref:Cbb3-type cytochrome oxidase subunit 1 n=1 Tax=Ammoniphilus resinae TaxID=861532 RepID=A0ABS4GPG1_9BACL|nr:cbb3-type cytochrome c oxidase subunit I [Ammoniphilus resinae]MBP1932165.1 cbb3-type cytochrome oxidase subunit 1 [Ammoniphilus resinae]